MVKICPDPPIYSGMSWKAQAPCFLLSFQRTVSSRPSLKPSLTLALFAARNFDLQKSEDMLRKVRPHSHESPASHTVDPMDQ